MRNNGSNSSTSDGRPSLSPDDTVAGDPLALRINSNTTTRTISHAHSTSPRPIPSIPTSASPTKHSPVHPHYCPARYHAPSTDAKFAERHRSDNDGQHWDNVFLNSHLSVDAWKSQSNVVKKASQQQQRGARLTNTGSDGDDDDEADNEDDAAAQNRGRTTRWRRRSSAEKSGGSQASPKKEGVGWKVKGISWAIGVSGV